MGQTATLHRLFLLAGLLASAPLAAGEARFAWIEAEKPVSANFALIADAQNAELLSGGQRILKIVEKAKLAQEVPAEGLLLRYEFETAAAGSHEVWVRIGFEEARAAMGWRLDQGEWAELASDARTANVMEIANWNSMAWARCGKVELTKGKHAIEIRFQKPGTNGRLMVGLDCFAIVQGEGGFAPEGVLKPGESYAAAVDRQAAAHVFRFPEGAGKEPGARVELPLDGLWQAARYDDPDMDVEPYAPVRAIPDERTYPLRWMGIAVPGNAFEQRLELMFAHRFFYQTRIDVPKELEGRGFFLRFSGTAWIVSVFVNGQLCGERKSVLVPWDLDISRAVKPGAVNTIVIGVKSSGYATDGKTPTAKFSRNEFRHFPRRGKFPQMLRYVDTVVPTSKGEGDGLDVGLVNPVKLVVAGSPYSADVFVKPSVARKRLEAEVEVRNPGTVAAQVEIRCEAVREKTGKIEKTFGPSVLSVPAGESKLQTVGGEARRPVHLGRWRGELPPELRHPDLGRHLPGPGG